MPEQPAETAAATSAEAPANTGAFDSPIDFTFGDQEWVSIESQEGAGDATKEPDVETKEVKATQEPPKEQGDAVKVAEGDAGEQPAPEVTQEAPLIFGRFKSMEDAEKGYREQFAFNTKLQEENAQLRGQVGDFGSRLEKLEAILAETEKQAQEPQPEPYYSQWTPREQEAAKAEFFQRHQMETGDPVGETLFAMMAGFDESVDSRVNAIVEDRLQKELAPFIRREQAFVGQEHLNHVFEQIPQFREHFNELAPEVGNGFRQLQAGQRSVTEVLAENAVLKLQLRSVSPDNIKQLVNQEVEKARAEGNKQREALAATVGMEPAAGGPGMSSEDDEFDEVLALQSFHS